MILYKKSMFLQKNTGSEHMTIYPTGRLKKLPVQTRNTKHCCILWFVAKLKPVFGIEMTPKYEGVAIKNRPEKYIPCPKSGRIQTRGIELPHKIVNYHVARITLTLLYQ